MKIHLTKLYFSIRTTKSNFLSKTPYQKWNSVCSFNIFLLKLTGTHVMSRDWKKSMRLLIPAWLEVNMFTLMIYTTYYYRNDLIKALEPTTLISLMLPVSCFIETNGCHSLIIDMCSHFQSLICYILVVLPSTHEKYRRIHNFGGDYIYSNSRISEEVNSVCDRMAIDLVIRSIIVNCLISLSLVLTIVSQMQKIILTGEYVLIIPIILPFIDVETRTGYLINTLNHLAICALGTTVIPALELITCVIKNNASVMAAVIKSTILGFAKTLKRSDHLPKNINSEFRNIVLRIMDFERLDVVEEESVFCCCQY